MTYRARLRSVKSHYVALVSAYRLRFGKVRDFSSPRNFKHLLGFVAFLNRTLQCGPTSIKEECHRWRERVMHRQTNPTAARKEFLASTLSRSIYWQITAEEDRQAVAKAEARWCGIRRVDTLLFDDLRRYIDQLPLTPYSDEGIPDWPVPNDHSCLTHPRKEGGTAVALMERQMRDKLQSIENLYNGQLEPTFIEKVTGVIKETPIDYLMEEIDDVADMAMGHGSLPGGEFVHKYLVDPQPSLRALPIHEMGGKNRIVTLHPAEEVFNARRINQLWLKKLANCVTSKSMLRNLEVRLEPVNRHSQLYSADLKAATDYIDHRLAQFVAQQLCRKLNRPHDLPVVERLFGSKVLPNGTATSSGIHMGLGPTWTILSILNGFAAWHAGANKNSYHVCGDDLIGFWPRKLTHRYVDTLERLGLVVNQSKSFYGRHGVFCERLVSIEDDGSAVARDVGHMSSITAAKFNGRRTNHALAVASQLESNQILREVSDLVRRRLVPRRAGPGRVRDGGNGFGKPTRGILLRLLEKGPLNLSVQPLPMGVGARIADAAQPTGQIKVSDFVVELKSALQASQYLSPKKDFPSAQPLSKEEFLYNTRQNRRHVSVEDLRKAIRVSRLNSSNRKMLLSTLRHRYPATSSARHKRLFSIARRASAERYISSELASQLLTEYGPANWKSRLVPEHQPRGPDMCPYQRSQTPVS